MMFGLNGAEIGMLFVRLGVQLSWVSYFFQSLTHPQR
jgi:hypothetical protein